MRMLRVLLVSVAVLLVSGLAAACSAAGSRDPGPYQPATGSNVRTEQVDAFGLAVVVDGHGNGRVVGTLLNTEGRPHAVTGAAVKTDGAPVRAAVLADVVRLPPHQPVDLADRPPVSVSADEIAVGSFVELTLDVTDGELVEVLVPVEATKGPYADIDVVPVADPAAGVTR